LNDDIFIKSPCVFIFGDFMAKLKFSISALALIFTCFTAAYFVSPVYSLSETPQMQWQQNFSGTHGYSVLETPDGGFLIAASNHSSSVLIKTDSLGKMLWAKNVQVGAGPISLPYMVESKDGNYALAGTWQNQTVLVKVDAQGNVLWSKAFGVETSMSFLRAFTKTSDGGYAVVGVYMNETAGVSQADTHNLGVMWLLKTNSEGNVQWKKTVEETESNFAASILQTSDGGYAIPDTNWVPGPHPSTFKLIKLDSAGNEQWSQAYGGSGKFYVAECDSGIITGDGGFLLSGVAGENNSPWSAWLVKTDSQGNPTWNQTFGGGYSMANYVIQTQDGGYAFAGILNGTQAWLVKTNSEGFMEWNQTFKDASFVGSSIEDFGGCLIQTQDGGYVVVGNSNSQIWIAKLAPQTPATIGGFEVVAAVIVLAAAVVVLVAILLIQRRKSKKISFEANP
jgi:hypothetical protein